MYIWIWFQLLYCCNISVLAQIPFQGIFIPSQNNIWLQRGWLVFSPNQMNPPTIPSQNNQRWSAIGYGQPSYGKESDEGYSRENGNQKDDQASELPPLDAGDTNLDISKSTCGEEPPEYVPIQIDENRNISDSTLETSNQTDEQQLTDPTTPTLNKNDIHETSSKEGDLKHSSEFSDNKQVTFNTINNGKPKTRPPITVTTTSGFTSRTMINKEHLQKSAERKNAHGKAGNNDLHELNSPQSLDKPIESGESTTVDAENNNDSETTSALNDGTKPSELKTVGTENNESETTSNDRGGKESPQDTLPHPNENGDDGKLPAPESRSAVNFDNNSLSTPTPTDETGPSKPETRDTESNNKSETTSNDNGGEEPSQVSLRHSHEQGDHGELSTPTLFKDPQDLKLHPQ